MKRLTRRTLAIVLGLALGWWCAGLAPQIPPAVGVSFAEEAHDTSASDHAAKHGQEDPHDSGHSGANELVPKEGDTPWFKPVIIATMSLFLAAIVLGIPALKLRGPEPPDPADASTHDHDEHGESDD